MTKLDCKPSVKTSEYAIEIKCEIFEKNSKETDRQILPYVLHLEEPIDSTHTESNYIRALSIH